MKLSLKSLSLSRLSSFRRLDNTTSATTTLCDPRLSDSIRQGDGSSLEMRSCIDTLESLLDSGSGSAQTLTQEHLAAIKHLRSAYSSEGSDEKISSTASLFLAQAAPMIVQEDMHNPPPVSVRRERPHRTTMRANIAEMEENKNDEDLRIASECVLDTYGGMVQLSRSNSIQILPKGKTLTKSITLRGDKRVSGVRLNKLLLSRKEHEGIRSFDPDNFDTLSNLFGSNAYCPPEWTALTTEAKTKLANLLSWESLSKWDFDIVKVAELSREATTDRCCPLLLVGWALLCEPVAQDTMRFTLGIESEVNHDLEEGDLDSSTGNSKVYHYKFDDHMRINPQAICNFLREVESRYKPENPYHNNIHAADITQTLHCLFQLMGEQHLMRIYDPIAIFSHLLAATFHDIGHPGTNNLFQQNAMTQLAIMHNDVSILESMHSSLGHSLLMGEDQNDKWGVFEGWLDSAKMHARRMMIDAILGTDMSNHFESVAKLESRMDQVQLLANDIVDSKVDTGIEGDEPKTILSILAENLDVTDKSKAKDKDSPKSKLKVECRQLADMLIKFILHTADISNPAKKKNTAVYWADCALSEFFAQGDKEKEMGLPISPLCDRETVKRADSQIGFTSFVIRPTFELIGEIIPRAKEEILPCIINNLQYWKREKSRMTCLPKFNKLASFEEE